MHKNKPKVRDQAHGKWGGILRHFGLNESTLTGKHGPCPLCADGKDRFRFDDKNGSGGYICGQCGSGDGFSLLQGFMGWDFKTAADEIEKIVGVVKTGKINKGISTDRAMRKVVDMWNQSRPVTDGDEVMKYLRNRGLNLSKPPSSVRLHPGSEYWEGGEMLGVFPVMVSMVASPAGKGITLHRTYLKDGQKAPVPKAKKMLAVSDEVTINGSAIRLSGSSDVIGVGEGIETALAAGQMFDMPVWSVISTTGMETFELPNADVKKLIVFGDNDINFAGQKSAYALANRMSVIKKIQVEVMFPPKMGSDWLDELNRMQ